MKQPPDTGTRLAACTRLHVITRHPHDYVLIDEATGQRWRGSASGRWVADADVAAVLDGANSTVFDSSRAQTFAERCLIAQECLPHSQYRQRLTALHDEMLEAIESRGTGAQEFGPGLGEPSKMQNAAKLPADGVQPSGAMADGAPADVPKILTPCQEYGYRHLWMDENGARYALLSAQSALTNEKENDSD